MPPEDDDGSGALEERVGQLEDEVAAIQHRNRLAELDHAWDTSWTRRILITLLTYIAIAVYFLAIDLPTPFISAVVPAVAFVLATMSLPWFQPYWERYVYSGERPHREDVHSEEFTSG
ncbi:MAG: hypothetical protein SVU88_02755 [Candidatus Nanohaloarchaea archaeon]|nr:hypothetical protein [Candidatus Nanohaloarchaea archaeon]